MHRDTGSSFLEILFAIALMAITGGIAVPPVLGAIDDFRAVGAARYVSARLQRARTEAVLRSANVGMRFTTDASGYAFALYVDGNRNGVLAADIADGVDWRLGAPDRLSNHFRGVQFGTRPGLPPVDPGGTAPGEDPIRLGASNTASFTASGTASTGSVYIRGANDRQLVVRIYGDTGKTRILQFDARSWQWKPL